MIFETESRGVTVSQARLFDNYPNENNNNKSNVTDVGCNLASILCCTGVKCSRSHEGSG